MQPILELRGITKRFGPILANDHIDLEIRTGEIHCLLGENGAGKTTLMNIAYGLYSPDDGQILVKGRPVEIPDSTVALGLGIGMVHQHFMLVKPFTVAENIVLGAEPRGAGFRLDRRQAAWATRELAARFGFHIDPEAKIQDLSVGQQQRVEILKALYRGAEVLILDEPTAVLTPQEVDELGQILRSLADQGKAIVFITHKLREVMDFSDVVTVIRAGRKVGEMPTERTNAEQLAELMVGRKVSLEVEKGEAHPGETVLEVRDLWVDDNRGLPAVKGLDLEVRAGEILGIAGVDGNGQAQLVEALTGLRPFKRGTIRFRGRAVRQFTAREARELGIGHIPSDRHNRGLVLAFSLAENLILGAHHRRPYARGFLLQRGAIENDARRLLEEYDVRPPDPEARAGSLSGGNQQKAVVAREMSRDPDLMIAAQPTRGLDVGAIEFVHRRLVEARDAGKAILLISMELEEILGLSDRIGVMYEGRIIARFERSEATEEKLGIYMAGGPGSDRVKEGAAGE